MINFSSIIIRIHRPFYCPLKTYTSSLNEIPLSDRLRFINRESGLVYGLDFSLRPFSVSAKDGLLTKKGFVSVLSWLV